MERMEPNAFVAEVYRRMSLRSSPAAMIPPTPLRISQVAKEYAPYLPKNKDAAILDIGYGDGWFLGACRSLGYTNLSGAEFNIDSKPYLTEWGIALQRIEKDIGEFLSSYTERYDFIHMSHVVEHIPKYSLLWIVDALYKSLRKGGVLFLRTPNMEGITPNSSYYVTLGHEYGFCGSNLRSLLAICGFDEIQFHSPFSPTGFRQKAGAIVRSPFLLLNRVKHRLFGVNVGGYFGVELVVSGRRGDFPPLFDPKFR